MGTAFLSFDCPSLSQAFACIFGLGDFKSARRRRDGDEQLNSKIRIAVNASNL